MWTYNKFTRTSQYRSDCGVLYTVLWPYLGAGLTYQIWVQGTHFWEMY